MSAPTTQRTQPTQPDPRPQFVAEDGRGRLRGWRCVECGVARATEAPSCPDCNGRLGVTDFGPEGTVWSSTVVHLDITDIPAPYVLAYVDLDAGPRFLAHVPNAKVRLPVGSRVAISGVSKRGDIEATPTGTESGPT